MTVHEKVKTINTQIEYLQDLIKQDCQCIKLCQKRNMERRERIKQLKEERRKVMFSQFKREEK